MRQRQITAHKDIALVMPRGTVMAPDGLLWFPDVEPGNAEWRAAEEGLRELIDNATRAGSKVVLALAPNSGLIYGLYAKGHKKRFQIIEGNRHRFVSFLRNRFASEGVMVVDLTDTLRERVGMEAIAEHEGDYHLNDRGVEIVFQELRQVIVP